MTVAAENTPDSYVGDDSTDTYAYTFRIFDETDLLVSTEDDEGERATLSYPDDYSVSGVDDPDGGDIVLVAGNLADGTLLSIRPNIPITQPIDIRNNGQFLRETMEDALDRLTMIAQQLDIVQDRTMRFSETYTGGADPTLPDPEAGTVLAWNADEDGLENISPGSVDLVTPGSNTADNTVLSDMAQGTTKLRARGAGTGDPIDGNALQLRQNAFDNASGEAQTAHLGDDQVTTAKIPDEAITLPKHADLAEATAIGRAAGAGTGAPQALTGAQLGAIVESSVRSGPNMLSNGCFRVWQRYLAPPSDEEVADNEYAPDRWVVLTESNPIDVKQLSVLVAGSPLARTCRMTQKNASAQQLALAQYLERDFVRHLSDKAVQARITVRCSAARTVRLAVYQRTSGTEDSLSADPISAWGATPTFTEWELVGSEDATLVADTWTEISLAATFPDSATTIRNVMVVVYTEDQMAQNETLDLTAAEFVEGALAPSFYPRHLSEELALCYRYFYVARSAGGGGFGLGHCISTTQAVVEVRFPEQIRSKTPDVLVSAASDFEVVDVTTDRAVSAIVATASGVGTNRWVVVTSSSLTTGRAVRLQGKAVTDTYLAFNAEIGPSNTLS